MRYRQIRRLLNFAIAAIIAAMLFALSSISLIEGHNGLCHNLARRIADQHSECHHHNDFCSESAEAHQHLHEYVNAQSDEKPVNQFIHQSVSFLESLQTACFDNKPETRPPEEPDQLRHHASQVMLI